MKVIKTFDYNSIPGPHNFRAISEGFLAYAEGLSMELLILPGKGKLEPHNHKGFETAIFILKGKGIVKYGPELENEIAFGPGQFIYIGPYENHQPINAEDEPIVSIISRNTPYRIEEKILEGT